MQEIGEGVDGGEGTLCNSDAKSGRVTQRYSGEMLYSEKGIGRSRCFVGKIHREI